MRRKLLAGFLAITMVFPLAQVGNVKAETEAKETIASLDYTYTDKSDVEIDETDPTVVDLNKEKYGSKNKGYQFTEGEARLFASVTGEDNRTLEWSSDQDIVSPEYKMGEGENEVKEEEPVMTASDKNPWTENTVPYFEVQLNTTGYENIDFSAYVGASKKGPRDYQLSYALGTDGTFTRLDQESAKIELEKNKKMTEISGTLPEEADNQELVRVRIEIISMMAVDQTNATETAAVLLTDNPTGGEAAINHIAVKGLRRQGTTEEPTATEPTATEPAVTEPVETEPAVTEPAGTEPVVTTPAVTEPVEETAAPTESVQQETTAPVDTSTPIEFEGTEIAGLHYTYTDAGDVEVDEEDATVSDLNAQKYGNKTDGYVFTAGTAKLFASVTGSNYKTLEWSKDDDDSVSAEYEMGYGAEAAKEAEPVMASTKKNPWTEGTVPYFEVQFSTTGYKGVSFSAYIGASKKGPKDYQLSYAVGDSQEFTRLDQESAKVQLVNNKKMRQIAGILPEAADNQAKVRVRIEIVTLETLDQSGAVDTAVLLTDNPTKGEAAINHISIRGSEAGGSQPQPTAPAKSTTAPTVTPTAKPGSTVAAGPESAKVTVKKLKITKKKVTLKKGKKCQLKVSFKVSGATKAQIKKELKWTSSNKKVAKVSQKGKITAKKKGKAKITVKYKKQKATCKVTVKK